MDEISQVAALRQNKLVIVSFRLLKVSDPKLVFPRSGQEKSWMHHCKFSTDAQKTALQGYFSAIGPPGSFSHCVVADLYPEQQELQQSKSLIITGQLNESNLSPQRVLDCGF